MRDFRDAKAMAQTLRESLTTKAINISHSESLELTSKMLGVADWNTLSALLQAGQRDPETPVAQRLMGTVTYPAIPIRDLVPFPTATYPLFVGREKTMQALNQAFERQREVVLAIQRKSSVDEPGLEDVYEIGVLAQLLEVERLDDGTLKVLTQVRRRVAVRRFVGESGAFQAEVADVSEGPIPEAPELIRSAAKRFESYAAPREIRLSQIWPPLDQTRDPGRVADIIASYMALPIGDKQSLLATLDPVARLTRVDALMSLSVLTRSPTLDVTIRRALDYANQRKHQYATLEHLLLALIDDADAAAVLAGCNADLDTLKAGLVNYLDNGLKDLVIENGGDAKPTAAFQRVAGRAALHAQELGRPVVTGANTLFAIFPEVRSPAARLLGEQGVSRGRVADFIAHHIG
ncbi:MAG: LON peptidase substrate-binding domain-containing protein [Bradyrhizobium sp.]